MHLVYMCVILFCCCCCCCWAGLWWVSDVNECAQGLDDCPYACNNTIGSFDCICGPGTEGDGVTCISEWRHGLCVCVCVLSLTRVPRLSSYPFTTLHPLSPPTLPDIDECARDTDGCEETCTDTDGGYECGCTEGYELGPDGHACVGMSEAAAAAAAAAADSSSLPSC